MITISIQEETVSHEDMAQVLEDIAEKIKRGFTSGYGPTWFMEGLEEPEEWDDGEKSFGDMVS